MVLIVRSVLPYTNQKSSASAQAAPTAADGGGSAEASTSTSPQIIAPQPVSVGRYNVAQSGKFITFSRQEAELSVLETLGQNAKRVRAEAAGPALGSSGRRDFGSSSNLGGTSSPNSKKKQTALAVTDGILDTYSIEGVLIRDRAPGPAITAAAPSSPAKSPSNETATSRSTRNMLAMLAASQPVNPLAATFAAVPPHVEESLAPLTQQVRDAAAARYSTMVVHRSTPLTNQGGMPIASAGTKATKDIGGSADQYNRPDVASNNSQGATKQPQATRTSAGPAGNVPSVSEYYFPQLVDALLHAITPATDRALQIVADDVAKERQMMRLRAAGGEEPMPIAPSPSVSATKALSVARASAISDPNASGGVGIGDIHHSPQHPSSARSTRDLSPTLRQALRSASKQRDEMPASSRRPHPTPAFGSTSSSYSGRPHTAGTSPAKSHRFGIYTSAANYVLPVQEHNRTLTAAGFQVKPPGSGGAERHRERSVAFGGSHSDEINKDNESDEENAKKGGLKRSASLRRKSSMRALEDFEANRPSLSEGPIPPLPGNGWSDEMTIFEFDGLRSYLQLPAVPDMDNLIKNFAVDFWLLTDCKLREGRRTILQIGESASRPDVGMLFHVGLNWYPDLDEGLRIYVRDASNRVCEVVVPFAGTTTGASILEGNEPHHFRIVITNLEESKVEAFVDGEAVENLKFLQTEHAATFTRWTGHLFVGGTPSGEGMQGQQEVHNALRGSVFEIRFWRGEGNPYSHNSPFANGNGASSFNNPLLNVLKGTQGAETLPSAPIGGGAANASKANAALTELVQYTEPWVRWPLVNMTMHQDTSLHEATRRIADNHYEYRNDLREIQRYAPRVCPSFDGENMVINMGTMSCFGDFLNHFEVELVFKTSESKRSMSLFGVTDSQHKMSEVGVVLNAEPVIGKERYRYHEHTITFYMVDCNGRCLSAFIRGSERNNVVDGKWHTLRIKVVDAEQGSVEAKIDGLARETIKVVKEGPRTFLALKEWVCIGGHNNRSKKVTNLFQGQISYVNFVVRGEDFATLSFTEGPGASMAQDVSGRRNHGLFIHPVTRRNMKNGMNWSLIFDNSSSHSNGEGAAVAAAHQMALLAATGRGSLTGAVDPTIVMHKNNTVRVAVTQYGAEVIDGKASEVVCDLLRNCQIDLEQTFESAHDPDRGFGVWMNLPAESFAEVSNSQRLRETVSYALRSSPVKSSTRHTLVIVKIGDATISVLDINGPHYQQGSGISFDRQLLKWVPHAISTSGDANKAMMVVNDQTSGLWRALRELTATPNIVLKLGPGNQLEHKVTAAQLLHALQDAGTRWRLALTVQDLLMNAYLRSSIHFVCSVSANATSSDVESIVYPQKALWESARDRAAIYVQRIWRSKLARLLLHKLFENQRIRKQRVEEIISLRKTNPLVLPKKNLRALVITLHAYTNPRFDPVDVTVAEEVFIALSRQGYAIEHLENPTKSQLSKAFQNLEPDSSHFVYIHGYGGFVRLKEMPPAHLDRLSLGMEEETDREDIMLQATMAFGHIAKERWADFAAVKALLASMPAKKGKKKMVGGGGLGSTVTSARAGSPLGNTLSSATGLNATTATTAASGLNVSPRRPASSSVTPRGGRNTQTKAQQNAFLLARQKQLAEEFRVVREDLEVAEQHGRHHDILAYEDHSWILLLQEFSKVLRQTSDFVRKQHQFEGFQAQLAAATITMPSTSDLIGAPGGGGKGFYRTIAQKQKESVASGISPSAFPAPTNWYVFPCDAKRLEPFASDLVSVDDILAKALQQPTPPLGYQCVVALDLLAPTPACHGGALIASSTGHQFTFAYDGSASLSAASHAAKRLSMPAAHSRGPRRSYNSPLGNVSGPAGATSANQHQCNILSWVLAKALSGHVPRIPIKNKEAYLHGASETPVTSGQRDWRSFATYVATKVDAYVRNDTTTRQRKEEAAILKLKEDREAAAASTAAGGVTPLSPNTLSSDGDGGSRKNRKRLSQVLSNLPSIAPAVTRMLEKEVPFTADVVPVRSTPVDPEERERRRREREMKRVTSFAIVGVEAAKVVGDMQYEFRPLLKHVVITDISMSPTIRLQLGEANKDIDSVNAAWIENEALKVLAASSADLSVAAVRVLGSGIYIDVAHSKGDRTRLLQGTQLLAARASGWTVPLLPSYSVLKDAAIESSQIVFVAKCTSPLRKMRNQQKDILLNAVSVPPHLNILKYGLNVE